MNRSLLLCGALAGCADPFTSSSDSVTGPITGFTLVDTDTHAPVAGFDPIANGATISLAAVGTHLSVQAETAAVGSVVFSLDGSYSHTETAAPYSLCGDEGGAFNQDPCSNLGVGSHTLTAHGFSGASGTGTDLGSLTISFSIVQSSAAITGFTLVNTDAHAPVTGFNPIANGATIDLSAIGTHDLSVQAIAGAAGSVAFTLDGSYSHTESAAPFSLCGDNGGNYNQTPCANLVAGHHTLAATAFSGANGAGTQLGSISTSFTITGGSTNTVLLTHFGSVGHGGDDTSVFDTAIASTAAAGQTLEIPAGTYNVMPLTFKSHTHIQCDAGVTVQDYAAYDNDVMLGLYGFTDISIIGPGGAASPSASACVFQMPKSKAKSLSDKVEYRHCLVIESTNVTVRGIACNNAGGDGLYIRQASTVTVSNSIFDGVFRNACSVTGQVNGLTLSNNHFDSSLRAGFDFEPNTPADYLQNITLTNNTTSNNPGGGLSVGPYALDATTRPISIAITGHVSNNNGGYGYFFTNSNTGSDPAGTVKISNSSTDNSAFGGAYGRKSAGGWVMTFDHVTITNPNRLGKDPHYQMNSATGVAIFGGEPGTPGGVAFTNMTISNAAGYQMVNYYQMDDDPIATTFSCASCSGATNSSAGKSYP